MLTPRERYQELLQALEGRGPLAGRITIEEAAESIGRSIAYDLQLLAASPHRDVFERLIESLGRLRSVSPRILANTVSRYTAGLELADTGARPSAADLYTIGQTLEDLGLKPRALPGVGRKGEALIERLRSYVRELHELLRASGITREAARMYTEYRRLEERLGYGPLSRSEHERLRLITAELEKTGLLERFDDLYEQLSAVISRYPDIEELLSPSVRRNAFYALTERIRLAAQTRRALLKQINITVSVIEGAREGYYELMRSFGPRELEEVFSALPQLQGLPTPPHGGYTGTPQAVKEAIEHTSGLAELRQYVSGTASRLAEEMEAAAEVGEARQLVEAAGSGGLEAARRRISSLYALRDPSYRLQQMGRELVAGVAPQDRLEEWSRVMDEGRRVLLPGSSVPFEVTAIDREGRTATLRPVSVPARDVAVAIRLAPGSTSADVKRALGRLEEAESLARSIQERAAGFEGVRERVVGLLLGDDVKPVALRSLMQDIAKSRGGIEELYRLAIAYLPWVQNTLAREDIATSSWLALESTLSQYGMSIESPGRLDMRAVGRLLEDTAFSTTYSRNLLNEIFGLIRSTNEYSSIRSLFDYVKENLRGPGGRRLSQIETARLIREAIGSLSGEPGTAHLRHISRMSVSEIIDAALSEYAVETSLDELLEKSHAYTEWVESAHGQEITGLEPPPREIPELTVIDREALERRDIGTARSAFKRMLPEDYRLSEERLNEIIGLMKRYPFPEHEDLVVSFADLDEATAAKRLEEMLELRRYLGGHLQMEFSLRGETPIRVARGGVDIIGVNLMSGERFVIGPPRVVTVGTHEIPRVLETDVLPGLGEGLEDLAGFSLVRSAGVSFSALRGKTADIPDLTLSAFHRLRDMKEGRSYVLAGLDWETTTLPDRGLPFYPTEAGFVADELRMAAGAYERSALARESILFKPSEEVAAAVGRLTEGIEEQLRRGTAVSLKRNEFEFLQNISKYSDIDATRLASAADQRDRVRLVRRNASLLVEGARRGMRFLESRGMELDEGLRRLAELMQEHNTARTILFGQNMLAAEYAWGQTFATMASPVVNYRFRVALESFFRRPRIELMILDRFMRRGGLGRSTSEAQFGRWISPVLIGGEDLQRGAGDLVRSLGVGEGITHRGLEDITAELGILYSHLGRELPLGADIRRVRRGAYFARLRAPRVGGTYALAEEGRPVRGVFRYRDVVPVAGGYAAEFHRLEKGPAGELIKTGDIERIYAPNLMELSRRVHEEMEYLPSKRAASRIYDELVEDYARREVLKATRSAARLGELLVWNRYGLPSPEMPAEAVPENVLSVGLAEAAEKAARGEPLTPAEELLYGAGYRQPRDVSVRVGAALGSEELLSQGLTGYRTGRLRRASWQQVAGWLESEEGRAYRTILEDITRFRALGILDRPSREILSEVEGVWRSYIAEHGLEPARAPRYGIFSLGTFELGGRTTGELTLAAHSLEQVKRRLEGFVGRTARKFDVGAAAVWSAIVAQLRERGILSRAVVDREGLAAELYAAAISGRLPQATVELRHIPTITTPEQAQEFLSAVRQRVIYPSLTIVGPGESVTAEEIEERISSRTALAARAERYRQAMESLAAEGRELYPLHPAVRVPVLTTGLIEEVEEAAISTDELISRLRSEAEAVRRETGRLTRAAMEERGLGEMLDDLYSRLGAEIMSEAQPTWEALGWGASREALGEAYIPLFGGPHDTFMRQLKEFRPEELRGLAASFGESGSPVARRVSGLMGLYAGTLAQQAEAENLVREATAAVNEAVKEKAAERAAAGAAGRSTVGDMMRGLNQAIKEKAAWPARNWKLLGGLGLAAAATSLVLRHHDREDYTTEGEGSYSRAQKPTPLGPVEEGAVPYNRPAPVDERSGLRVKIRGRARSGIDINALSAEIGRAANNAMGINTNINIRTQDDRTAINEQFAKEVFAQLLKYGQVVS